MNTEKNFIHNAINLKHVHAAPLLHDINMTVTAGTIHGITGRKGSGKTTLLRCINLLHTPQSGIVHVNGTDLNTLASRDLQRARRNIGMLPAVPAIYNNYTVGENIGIVLQLLDSKTEQLAAQAQDLLQLVDLSQYATAQPQALNRLQYKCLALAMAMANSPLILLCDDITATLDTSQADSILKILEKIKNILHTTIVLATRDIHSLKTICDSYAILDHGKIIAQGPIIQAFTQANSKNSKHILQAIARSDLPSAIKRTITNTPTTDTVPIVRIVFTDHRKQELVLTQLIQNYQIKINIIQAHIDKVKDHALGIMLVHLMGDPLNINQALNFLQQQNIYVEELGYAANPIITA